MAEKKAKTAKKPVETVAPAARKVLRSRDGVVVSDKMEKTVIVAVTRQVRHPVYGKYIRRTKRYFAHDSKNQCGAGDRVRIVETRPLSRKTHWRIEEVLEKATAV